MLPDNFILQEFVHPDIFRVRGLDSIQLVSQFQLDYAALLRATIGVPLTINNWHKGGTFKNRGTRPRSSKPPGGGEFSQHYLARALDTSSAIKVPLMYQAIQDNFDLFFNIGLRCIEDIKVTRTWLHGDGRLLYPEQVASILKKREFLIIRP